MDKHFTLYSVSFRQRADDGYVDATQICQSKNKLFCNWSRSRAAQKTLSQVENSLYKLNKGNKHTWIHPDCLEPLISWVLREEFDFDTIRLELDKPFLEKEVDLLLPTTKKCNKCQNVLSFEHFGKNKRKPDGYDVRCKACYREQRLKNPNYSDRVLEYYHENKEKCNNKKRVWNRQNKDKVNAANRAAYRKRVALKTEEEKEEVKMANKEAENMVNNLTLQDKNDDSYTIICRESDGYINVTNLCKAGGKQFNHWHDRSKSKDFLKVLERVIKTEYQQNNAPGIPGALFDPTSPTTLIKYETGYGSAQATWVHPRVAINIAQWISPEFDVQVTNWVQQLFVLGEVKLTDKNTDNEILDIHKDKIKRSRLIKEGKIEESEEVFNGLCKKIIELEERNKETENKLQETQGELMRSNKLVEKRRRKQYLKGNVIYILRHTKFENYYKVGIARELTPRISTYNTCAPEDFEHVFHTYTMYNSEIETMVKKRFDKNLYSYSKEWYKFENGLKELISFIEISVKLFDVDINLMPTIRDSVFMCIDED